jgi:hypothetical protein
MSSNDERSIFVRSPYLARLRRQYLAGEVNDFDALADLLSPLPERPELDGKPYDRLIWALRTMATLVREKQAQD